MKKEPTGHFFTQELVNESLKKGHVICRIHNHPTEGELDLMIIPLLKRKSLEPLLEDIRRGKFGTKNRSELLTRLEEIMGV